MNKLLKLVTFLSLFLLSNNYIHSQWNVSVNLNGGQVNHLLSTGQYIFAATSTNGIYRSDDNGATWIQKNTGLENFLLVQTMSAWNNFVYAGTSGGGFFYSANFGDEWIQSNQGIGQLNVKVLMSDSTGVYAGLIFAGIFRSTNNGLSWSRFALGEGDLLYSFSFKSEGYLIGLEGGIYRSTNSGVNWAPFVSGLTNLSVRSVIQSDDKTYCGTFGGGVYYSDFGESQWHPMNSGLADLKVRNLFLHGTNLFAGIEGNGIFYFNQTSESWIEINQGLSDTNISAMTVKDNYIYTGSSAGKIWKRHLSEIITGIYQTVSELNEFQLYQNYPNPFNPSTEISFYIPEKNFVTLKVFNITGKEISEIHSGIVPEGKHTKYWNGENYSSGIYYYTLQSGSFSQTKKFALVK
ncbi:MAG: T9SS type A sorting domain-containing protein [Ignavibacteria bacterium]|nr:T9SS type A sorting domain-containing protein [Ignavibacteria bacterium]